MVDENKDKELKTKESEQKTSAVQVTTVNKGLDNKSEDLKVQQSDSKTTSVEENFVSKSLDSNNKQTKNSKLQSDPVEGKKNESKVINQKEDTNTATESNKKEVDSKQPQKKSLKSNSNSKHAKGGSNQNEESEYIEKLVSINRVAKVVKGGRRFSFAALVVVGDGNGLVGHGKGKAKEVPEAIKKATDEAKVNMIRVPLRQARTLHHDITGRYDSGKVYLRSAPSGTGVIAGGPMRAVFEALGIKDIVAKSVGSSNPHNMIRATFQALSSASSPKLISIRRGLKVNEITKRRKSSSVSVDGVSDG